MPRPTRLRFSEAFFGARTVDRFMTILSSQLPTFPAAKAATKTGSLRHG
jgi:hypothetical protein